jgi:Peptidase S24-like
MSEAPDRPSASPDAVAAVLRRKAANGPLWIPVGGRSMGSSIDDDCRVMVDPAATRRRGDIWAFTTGNKIVVHRLLRVRDGRAWLQGDANTFVDRPVPIDCLVGKVVRIERAGGNVERIGFADLVKGRWVVDSRAVKRRAVLFVKRLANLRTQ